MFKFWSYPDSFTSSNGIDTGRPSMVVDNKGNLHFVWHQKGNPDGFEVFYSRAIIDTSAGVIQYNVERPATMLSETNGQEEVFPSLQIYGDTLLVAVFPRRVGTARNAIAYNYSTDGGNTWAGEALAYDHGGTIPGSWIECSIAADPNTGDMWAATNFDYSGDGSMDVVVLYREASSGNWSIETVANATSMHPYALPALVVDYNGVPHIIFQENHTNSGGLTGLTAFYASGPFGQLFYTHRSSGSWSSPIKIDLPVTPIYNNYCSGWASTGIASDNTIYFSVTQPDSVVGADTSAYGTFNVHYAEFSPYTGALSYGGQVTSIPPTDSLSAIYPHITYHVPLGGEVPSGMQGPGITWSEMVNYAPPSNVYYNHSDTLANVEESVTDSRPSLAKLYQNYPNPVREKTMIRFAVPSNTDISLVVYDISGRLVKTLADGIPGAGSYFVLWNGEDSNGNEMPAGVYMYTLKAGPHTETRKLLLVR